METIPKSVIKRGDELSQLISYHQKRYHEEDAPEISDEVYDSFVRELISIIEKYPELSAKYKVVDAVGGKTNEAFTKVKHRVRQWSFDNVFTDAELKEWEERLHRFLEKQDVRGGAVSYVSEHKIDGLKIVCE